MALDSFVEERLELGIDYGAVGGPAFDTSVVTQRSGQDYRNINWPQAKGNWQIGDRVVTVEELDYILNFFNRRRGQAVGFRWKDWTDYRLTEQVCRPINATEYQIQKTYGDDDENAYAVDIHKIVRSTMQVFASGDPVLSGVAISTKRGFIRFDTPPSGTITVTGEFDKSVRFAVDRFETEFNAFDPVTQQALYTVSSIPLVEIR